VIDDNTVSFWSTIEPKDKKDSFFAMTYSSDTDEEIYGMGL
jgi:hypothetical protein